MKYEVWIITITTRGRATPPDHSPRIYTDFARAKSDYQHMCGSNVPVEHNRSHRYEHWKTKAIFRLEPVIITDPIALTDRDAARQAELASERAGERP